MACLACTPPRLPTLQDLYNPEGPSHVSPCMHTVHPPCPPLQDLYKPEGPRLRRHLSAILNFAMFREEKLAAYTALQEQLEGLLQVGAMPCLAMA